MSHQAGISQMSCPTCPEPCASFSKARLDSILFPLVVPKPGGGLFFIGLLNYKSQVHSPAVVALFVIF